VAIIFFFLFSHEAGILHSHFAIVQKVEDGGPLECGMGANCGALKEEAQTRNAASQSAGGWLNIEHRNTGTPTRGHAMVKC